MDKMTDKAIIFDSGALISFSMNGITDFVRDLKKVFDGKFLITKEIKGEIIDRPLKIKRFRLEALKLSGLLDEKVIELPDSVGVKDDEIAKRTQEILNFANSAFNGRGKDLHIMDLGEASGLALSKILLERKIKNVLVIDERTTRVLIENPENLKKFLERKLHVDIKSNGKNLTQFRKFSVIRSTELVYVGYKKGVLKFKSKNALDAMLYALKSKGAAITYDEIEEMKKLAG